MSWSVREYHDPDTDESPSDRMERLALNGEWDELWGLDLLRYAREAITKAAEAEDMQRISSIAEEQDTVDGIIIYTITVPSGVNTLAFAINPVLKEIFWLDFINGAIECHRQNLIDRCVREYGLAT